MINHDIKKKMTRRRFIGLVAAGATVTTLSGCTPTAPSPPGDKRTSIGGPNFIIIFSDDLGYGDLGCFGSTVHRTPNLDEMAAEGMKFTSFYVTSGVCTPSRASLMTGCYPKRVNMHEDSHGKCVLFPVDSKGLNPNEITIAEILKQRGYATCCIGKWHLGDQPDFLPTRQGFDYYFGIPYSNDMGKEQRPENPLLPLLRNEEVIEAPAVQDTLTKRYTEEAIEFIRKNKDRHFFLYLPHTMVHNPLNPGEEFRGKSANGRYGDAVEEIDSSSGRILKTLKELNLDNRTLVVFTSDNGASDRYGGSNSPLRGHKGTTWEGGMREPAIIRWPGRIPAGKTCDEITITMDLLPTFAHLAGAQLPADRTIDGKNIWPLMAGRANAKSPHEAFYYYQIDQLQAVRSGKWKLHLALRPKKRHWGKPIPEAPLALYDLENDVAEKNNVAEHHPDVVKHLLALAEKARRDLGDADREDADLRPAGWAENPKPLTMASKNNE
ncbi:MAG TPA: sulfatase [Sedimentisphaerales bacterium]|nr:sulfatase [Sedimentisphaerales bacterium]